MAAQAIRSDRLPIRTSEDIVLVRQHVRKMALEMGLSLVDQTKVVTAASEMARNTLITAMAAGRRSRWWSGRAGAGCGRSSRTGGRGSRTSSGRCRTGSRRGAGLGLGLGGAKRLSNEFEIQSTPGEGTRVTMTRWKASRGRGGDRSSRGGYWLPRATECMRGMT